MYLLDPPLIGPDYDTEDWTRGLLLNNLTKSAE